MGLPPDASVSAVDLLRAIETELGDLVERALALQNDLSPLLSMPGNAALHNPAVQALDLMTQRLDGLREFLATLVPALPEDWRIDPAVAIRRLKLGGLALRLSGQAADDCATAGALELF